MNIQHSKIQEVRNFWDKRPCNIKHSAAKVGTKRYFDEVEARKYFVEPHIPRFVNFIEWRGKRVLEIGCGIGTDTINFARNGAMVTAVDLSNKSLELAQKRAKVFGVEKQIKFYQANAEELSKHIPIRKYDLIYAWGVIHHTPRPQRVIAEIQKFTHKNSVVKLMIYYRYSWKVLWILLTYGKLAFWDLDKLVAKYSEAAIGSPVTYVYSKKEAKALLKNFTITQMFVDHIFPYEISEYVKYRYRKVWYFRYLPTLVFRFLETHFGWHLCITARPNLSQQKTAVMRRILNHILLLGVSLLILLTGMELTARRIENYHLWPPKLEKSSYFEMDKAKIWNSKFVEAKRSYFLSWPIPLETFNDNDKYPRYLFKKDFKLSITNCLIYSNHPNCQITWSSNSLGFRNREIKFEKESAKMRIVALGASTTEGSYSDNETYPYYLEQILTQKGRAIEIINAGHHGFGIEDIYALFREKIIPLKPDLVIFYEVSNNTNPEEWLQEKWAGWNSWSEGYATWFSVLYKHSLIFTQLAKLAGYESRIPPNIPHTFDTTDPKPALEQYKQSLEKIITAAQENSIEIVLTTFITLAHENLEVNMSKQPYLWQDIYLKWYPFTPGEIRKIYQHFNETVIDLAKSKNIKFIDLATLYPKDSKYFVDHIHFTPEGNQRLAELIATFLEQERLINADSSLP